jgi:hypothetical protein
MDLYNRSIAGLEHLLGIAPPAAVPPPPVDTTWHDQMVQNANRSFQQPQAAPVTPAAPLQAAARKKYPGMMSNK